MAKYMPPTIVNPKSVITIAPIIPQIISFIVLTPAKKKIKGYPPNQPEDQSERYPKEI